MGHLETVSRLLEDKGFTIKRARHTIRVQRSDNLAFSIRGGENEIMLYLDENQVASYRDLAKEDLERLKEVYDELSSLIADVKLALLKRGVKVKEDIRTVIEDIIEEYGDY